MSDYEFRFCIRIARSIAGLSVVSLFIFFLANFSMTVPVCWRRNCNASSMTDPKSVQFSSPSGIFSKSFMGPSTTQSPAHSHTKASPQPTGNPRDSIVEKRFCEFGHASSEATVFDQCHQILDPIMNLPDRNDGHNWLVFGDSTVSKIVIEAVHCASSYQSNRRRCDHCNYLTQTESIEVQNWTKPNKTQGEGPVAYGLEHPTCSDCQGCPYGILTKNVTDEESKKVLEQKIYYFPVEFARDVTNQCPAVGVKTTQESVEYYLKQKVAHLGNQWNTTTCLVSVGFHDMAIAPDIGITTYVQNVKDYIRRIRPFCRTLVWLGLHQVRGDMRHPQTNAKILQWNEGVLVMLLQSYPNDVVFIDTTNRTTNASEHHDNVHMEQSYYRSVAMFFFKNLTKFCA